MAKGIKGNFDKTDALKAKIVSYLQSKIRTDTDEGKATRREIAARLGYHHEHISTMLEDLKAQGVIAKANRYEWELVNRG